MRSSVGACTFLIATGLASSALAANTYYVDPGGDDAHSGTMAAPWSTLQHAAETVAAGDTVIVNAGHYVGFDCRASGTAAAPITFHAQAGVIIDQPNPNTPDGVNVEDASYVVVEGFEVDAMPRTGLRTAVGDHITFRNNKADANQTWGILTGFVDDLLIEGNETSNSIEQHGIYVGNSGDRPVIRGNLVHGNAGAGIHMNGDLSQGGDGIISKALVEGNIIYSNGVLGGSGINCDGVQDSIFRNNLIYDEHASGISLYYGDGAASSDNNVVVNNTFILAADGRWALNIQNDSKNTQVYDNIFLNLNPGHGSMDVCSPGCLVGFVSDYNVVLDLLTLDDGDSHLTLADWQSQTGQDQHSIVVADGSTVFVDQANNDYHLSKSSPAVDHGTASDAPSDDLDGNARPFGGKFDIGAYEYCGSACSPAMGSGGAGGSGSGGAGAGVGGHDAGPGAGVGGAGGGFKDGDGGGANGGCGCEIAGADGRAPHLIALALAALALLRRRQRVLAALDDRTLDAPPETSNAPSSRSNPTRNP